MPIIPLDIKNLNIAAPIWWVGCQKSTRLNTSMDAKTHKFFQKLVSHITSHKHTCVRLACLYLLPFATVRDRRRDLSASWESDTKLGTTDVPTHETHTHTHCVTCIDIFFTNNCREICMPSHTHTHTQARLIKFTR